MSFYLYTSFKYLLIQLSAFWIAFIVVEICHIENTRFCHINTWSSRVTKKSRTFKRLWDLSRFDLTAEVQTERRRTYHYRKAAVAWAPYGTVHYGIGKYQYFQGPYLLFFQKILSWPSSSNKHLWWGRHCWSRWYPSDMCVMTTACKEGNRHPTSMDNSRDHCDFTQVPPTSFLKMI